MPDSLDEVELAGAFAFFAKFCDQPLVCSGMDIDGPVMPMEDDYFFIIDITQPGLLVYVLEFPRFFRGRGKNGLFGEGVSSLPVIGIVGSRMVTVDKRGDN